MKFYSKFLDIHMKEKWLTCYDYYGFQMGIINKWLILTNDL
jgi:hypothetical protein